MPINLLVGRRIRGFLNHAGVFTKKRTVLKVRASKQAQTEPGPSVSDLEQGQVPLADCLPKTRCQRLEFLLIGAVVRALRPIIRFDPRVCNSGSSSIHQSAL